MTKYVPEVVLRVDAFDAVGRFLGLRDVNECGGALAHLLGFEDYNALCANETEAHRKLYEYLAGQHGYAIFKLLDARRDKRVQRTRNNIGEAKDGSS
jgi:hypothetical protein